MAGPRSESLVGAKCIIPSPIGRTQPSGRSRQALTRQSSIRVRSLSAIAGTAETHEPKPSLPPYLKHRQDKLAANRHRPNDSDVYPLSNLDARRSLANGKTFFDRRLRPCQSFSRDDSLASTFSFAHGGGTQASASSLPDEVAFEPGKGTEQVTHAAVRETGGGGYSEARAQFEGNPDYPEMDRQDAYEAAIRDGLRRLDETVPVPSETERRVARAVVATRGTGRHGLALAPAQALERGTPPTADSIRRERDAVMGQLRDGTEIVDPYEGRPFLRRVYRSYIAAETIEMSEGRGQLLRRLADGASRTRVRDRLLSLHRDVTYPEASPWRRHHDAIARAAGLDHRHERGLGVETDL